METNGLEEMENHTGNHFTRREFGNIILASAAGLAILKSPIIASAAEQWQDNWRWCSKCQGLFFAGNETRGVCPKGGEHTRSESGNYFLSLTSKSGWQGNWRWCSKCQGLFFAGNETRGVCPKGGEHTRSESGNYFLKLG